MEESNMMGSERISLSVSKAQESFSMELIPTTVDVAEMQYNLSKYLSLNEIMEEQKALSGEMLHIGSCRNGFYSLCDFYH